MISKIEKLEKELREEGYEEIYQWKDKPNKLYEWHSHKTLNKIIVIDGSMKIKIDSQELSLTAGNSVTIKQNEKHEVLIGNEGCLYLVGEK